MNVAIIGCGRMGQRRAAALGDDELTWACDPDPVVLDRFTETSRAIYESRGWRHVVTQDDVEAVIVCTPHNMLAEIANAAACAGKHVLVEKPGAMRADNLIPLGMSAWGKKVKVRIGYNLRYHRNVLEAQQIIRTGAIGDLMYVRGRYGHGGRLGMEKEWRCDPKQSGGGELIDQGVHLIDLARMFAKLMGQESEFGDVQSLTAQMFWASEVEDNVWLQMRFGRGGAVADLHASWTEWKNLFSFEIFGTRGKIEVSGLGGSYGPERCTLYSMAPSMGPPIASSWEWPEPDDSFVTEWQEFRKDIREDREPSPGIRDAQAVLRVVEEVYGR